MTHDETILQLQAVLLMKSPIVCCNAAVTDEMLKKKFLELVLLVPKIGNREYIIHKIQHIPLESIYFIDTNKFEILCWTSDNSPKSTTSQLKSPVTITASTDGCNYIAHSVPEE